MLKQFFHVTHVVALVAGLLTTGTAFAVTPTGPEWAVQALSKLSANDLDISKPAAKAFLDQLYAGKEQACSKPIDNRPDFDLLCSWSYGEDDFNLLIGIKGTQIVSIVTDYIPSSSDIWICEDTRKGIPESEVKTCSIRSADQKTRDEWAASWESFLSSIG